MNWLIHPPYIKTIVLIFVTIFIALIVVRLLQSFIRVPKRFKTKRSQTYVSVLKNLITAFVYIIAFYYILALLGINITPLLASAGIVGIALGFGARPLIEDLIAGIFLLSQNSIAIGDYVQIADAEGYIQNIGFRTLSIRDLTGALYIIPNGQIKSVTNFSRHRAQVAIEIPVNINQRVDTIFAEFNKVISEMQKAEKKLGYPVFSESRLSGIEELKGSMFTVRVTLVTPAAFRKQVARDFKYKIKKRAEKKKIILA